LSERVERTEQRDERTERRTDHTAAAVYRA